MHRFKSYLRVRRDRNFDDLLRSPLVTKTSGECVTAATANSIGLIQPDTIVHADGATSYAFNNYAVDNSYTGNCNYTFLVRDSTMKYVVKLGPVSIPVSPGPISDQHCLNHPHQCAAGTGSAITVIQCGSTSGISAMPLFIKSIS